ncbi:hypothetical protein CEXT_751971, partial [Caerostris extrusa]
MNSEYSGMLSLALCGTMVSLDSIENTVLTCIAAGTRSIRDVDRNHGDPATLEVALGECEQQDRIPAVSIAAFQTSLKEAWEYLPTPSNPATTSSVSAKSPDDHWGNRTASRPLSDGSSRLNLPTSSDNEEEDIEFLIPRRVNSLDSLDMGDKRITIEPRTPRSITTLGLSQ